MLFTCIHKSKALYIFIHMCDPRWERNKADTSLCMSKTDQNGDLISATHFPAYFPSSYYSTKDDIIFSFPSKLSWFFFFFFKSLKLLLNVKRAEQTTWIYRLSAICYFLWVGLFIVHFLWRVIFAACETLDFVQVVGSFDWEERNKYWCKVNMLGVNLCVLKSEVRWHHFVVVRS